MKFHYAENVVDGDILVICPTRGRVDKLRSMVRSFNDNSGYYTKLICCVDDDDAWLEGYLELFEEEDVAYTVNPRKSITKLYNEVFEEFDEFKWYSCSNDDFIYRTPGWDQSLKSDGIAYGNDTFQGENIPSTSVINGNIVRVLGWLQLPTLTHLFGDNVWKLIGQQTGKLYYKSDVIIEHKHWLNGGTMDLVYKEDNSDAMYEKDYFAFKKWMVNESYEDILKIKKEVYNEV